MGKGGKYRENNEIEIAQYAIKGGKFSAVLPIFFRLF